MPLRLSQHFLLREFHSHDGVEVPSYAIDDYRRLCEDMLEPLRSRFGRVDVLSGYRSPRHNAAVGGAPRSFHVVLRDRRGAAADVKCAAGHAGQWYAFLDSRGAGGLGRYPGFVHVDNRTTPARW